MSTLRCTAIQSLTGIEKYLSQAWVNFNGTGTVAIRASGNVSSITDNGVGDYTVNFTNALVDANYGVSTVCQRAATDSNLFGSIKVSTTPTTSAVRISTQTGSATLEDPPYCHVQVIR